MPTTRSRSGGDTKNDAQPKAEPAKPSAGTKRKATSSSPPSKKPPKQAKIEPETGNVDTTKAEDDNNDDESITINRAPVLELWAACVAHTLHSHLSWETCLSIGGAIATLGAIAKGKSIGTIDKPSASEQEEKKRKRDEKEDELDEVHVMTFHLKLNGKGEAMVGVKPKKGNEEGLRKKFGSNGEYEKVREVMEKSLEGWKGEEDELNGRAFHMYEDFRPNVPKGQKGWGRKGELSLKTVKDVVSAG